MMSIYVSVYLKVAGSGLLLTLKLLLVISIKAHKRNREISNSNNDASNITQHTIRCADSDTRTFYA